MPYDANGNYTLPSGYKVANGQKVLPSQHNPPFEDVGAALSSVVVADGRKALAGDLKMGGNKVTGLANGTDLQDAATVGQAAAAIGDYKETVLELDETWLKRDGALYPKATYPDLATVIEAKFGALTDNVLWTPLTSGASGQNRALIQNGSTLIEYEDDGTNTKVRTSTDGGDNWTLASTVSSFRAYAAVFAGGIYVLANAVTGTIVTSTNNTSWSAPIAVTGFGTDALGGIAYGNGVYVAVGANGKISSSPDTATWTSRTSGTTQFLFSVQFVNGVFIATGGNGVIVTSTDGITWTLRTSGVTIILRAATFGNGLYVVVGATGTILTSSNLTSWTPRTSSTTQDLNAVAYSASGFMSVGNSGTVRISLNGTTWTTPANSIGSTASLNAVIADNSNAAKYYAAGSSGFTVRGLRTLPTQFQVPNDNPTVGWIKALAA